MLVFLNPSRLQKIHAFLYVRVCIFADLAAGALYARRRVSAGFVCTFLAG